MRQPRVLPFMPKGLEFMYSDVSVAWFLFLLCIKHDLWTTMPGKREMRWEERPLPVKARKPPSKPSVGVGPEQCPRQGPFPSIFILISLSRWGLPSFLLPHGFSIATTSSCAQKVGLVPQSAPGKVLVALRKEMISSCTLQSESQYNSWIRLLKCSEWHRIIGKYLCTLPRKPLGLAPCTRLYPFQHVLWRKQKFVSFFIAALLFFGYSDDVTKCFVLFLQNGFTGLFLSHCHH